MSTMPQALFIRKIKRITPQGYELFPNGAARMKKVYQPSPAV